MISTIKFFVCSIFLLLVLSIKINNHTIFSHVYSIISPATTGIQNTAENLLNKSLSSTQKYSKKLFDNSVPKIKDTIKAKSSAPLRSKNEPLEVLTDDDKAELDQLIRTRK